MTRREEFPHDKLTALCNVMLQALEADPNYVEGTRAIALVSQPGPPGERVAGTGLHGFDDDSEAVTFLFFHMRAILRSRGQDAKIIQIGDG